MERLEEWTEEQGDEHEAEGQDDPDLEVNPDDSVSQHSAAQSRTSSIYSARAKATARRAMLQAKERYLEKKQQIEYQIKRERLSRES